MWTRVRRRCLVLLARARRAQPLARSLAIAANTSTTATTTYNTTALPKTWFRATVPLAQNRGDDKQPVDERTLQLGKTIRILQERMPTLLHTPLPSDILSPHITLHLFPSTHPDLPTVRGRVAYIAALWTAPVAWGRLPGGSTRLEVLSERMTAREVLKVRWQAAGSPEICGIFTFEFDDEGRVVKHVIENTEEAGDGEARGVGSVITVTEWLMRKAKGGKAPEGSGGLAWQCERSGPSSQRS
ncbi:hypothetical protein EDC01DRAFT_172267 [Geopyxis carbonaria]|nr:hypothetical protein EDC01DRAFT_172267 [Geopyxis carbonaria]